MDAAEKEFEHAKLVLWEAVKLDQKGQAKPAIDKYIVGIETLLNCLSVFDGPKKVSLRQQVEEYMSRVETLRCRKTVRVDSMEQRRIVEDSTGHSYDSIFAKCLDAKVTEGVVVHVQDPWLSNHHQLVNLVKFCELLVRCCPSLKRISLLTLPKPSQMDDAMPKLGASLATRNITLTVKHEENLHDREIRFNNGWLVKMGRGLDIYKRVDIFSIGAHDYHLRPCKATLIEIFKITTN